MKGKNSKANTKNVSDVGFELKTLTNIKQETNVADHRISIKSCFAYSINFVNNIMFIFKNKLYAWSKSVTYTGSGIAVDMTVVQKKRTLLALSLI